MCWYTVEATNTATGETWALQTVWAVDAEAAVGQADADFASDAVQVDARVASEDEVPLYTDADEADYYDDW